MKTDKSPLGTRIYVCDTCGASKYRVEANPGSQDLPPPGWDMSNDMLNVHKCVVCVYDPPVP